jgi:hypothetical protein
MALIKAKKVEVEIQKQTLDKADCKYVVLLKYEPEDYISTEILSVVLTDEKPIVRQTIDLGDKIVDGNSD